MRLKSYVFLVIATLCWGGNAVAGKLAVGHVSPMVLTFCRWSFAMGVILALSLPQLKRDWPVVRRHLPLLFAYGAIGYTSFNALLYTALHHTSTINSAIVQAGIPMMIFLLNFALFRVRVAPLQAIGFALTLVGVAIVASHGRLDTLLHLRLNFGDALMLVAVTAYAIYAVALKWKPDINWKSLMAVPAFAALVTSVPLVFWEMRSGTDLWPDGRGWAISLYTGLFSSLIAQILFILGVEGIGPNRAGLFINLVPVFGTLLSILIIGESLEAYHAAALALALGGIAIAELGRQKAV
nr:DMT family transporter [uncultured Gellertiella sp.]